MNHLALSLSVEEPDVTSLSIRPGVVDTAMQSDVREVHAAFMREQDAARFVKLYKEGGLLRPDQPGNVMARAVLDPPADLSGQYLEYALPLVLTLPC